MNETIVRALITSSTNSITRSRNVFLVVLILSALQCVAAYNLYFSWLRTLATQDKLSSSEVVHANQNYLLRWWVDSTFVNIPVLGIRVHAADAGFAGSMLISFFMLANLFAMRKQNHAIGQAVRRIVRTGDLNHMRFAYYCISNELIFSPMSRNDSAIATLDDPNEEAPVDKISGIRMMVAAVFYFPGVAIIFGFITDVLSLLWIQSPFREGHKTVWQALEGDHLTMARAVCMLIVAVVLGMLCLYWGSRCQKYQVGTHFVMKKLAEKINESDPGA